MPVRRTVVAPRNRHKCEFRVSYHPPPLTSPPIAQKEKFTHLHELSGGLAQKRTLSSALVHAPVAEIATTLALPAPVLMQSRLALACLRDELRSIGALCLVPRPFPMWQATRKERMGYAKKKKKRALSCEWKATLQAISVAACRFSGGLRW